jgi:hypothetical protein
VDRALADIEDGLELEQWLDFATNRNFRQSCLAAGNSGILPADTEIECRRRQSKMKKQHNIAGLVLAAALVLVLPVGELKAAQEQSAAGTMQPAAAEDDAPGEAKTPPSSGMKVLDAVAVRPISFVASVFSAGTFVLALPFAAFDPALDAEKMGKNLVNYPFSDTFQRPLGDFNGSAW